jgi:elongation factor G
MLPLRQMISAQRPADAMALAEALTACAADDPSLVFARGSSPNSFSLEAATPNELARRLALVRAKAAIPIDAGQVTVQPCWTPGRLAEAEHRLGTADGGSGDFAVVRLRVVPRRSSEGNVFESEFAGPPEIDAFNAAVARGVAQVWAEGAEGEGRMIDTRVVFIDGAFHSSRSTPEGFEQAAVAAMRLACRTSGLRRLEPLMEIEIMSVRDHVLTVVNDLATRGGSELRRRLGPKGVVVVAELPMRALLTYEGDLATLTKGRGKLVGEPRLSRWAEARRR